MLTTGKALKVSNHGERRIEVSRASAYARSSTSFSIAA